EEAEAEPGHPRGQRARERQCLAVVAHAAEASYRGEPGAGERGKVQAVARVERVVAQVGESRLGEIVIGELNMADLSRHDRLDRSRQRGVADGDAFVVFEMTRLLLGIKAVAARV